MKRAGAWMSLACWTASAIAAGCGPSGSELDREQGEQGGFDAGREMRSEPAWDARSTLPEGLDPPEDVPDEELDADLELPRMPARQRLDAGAATEQEAGRAPGASSVLDRDALMPRTSDGGVGTRTVLVRGIPEAENLFFTESGRLFVSGGENVFEIKRSDSGVWSKVDLFHESCLVEGIVQAGDYLYGVCSRTGLDDLLDAYFFGGEITETPELRILAQLKSGAIPNGMAADEQGHVYTSCSGTGEILRFTFSTPLTVERTDVWSNGLTFVNGLKRVDGYMYFTALSDDLLASRMGRIAIAQDGSAGAAEYLFERPLTVLDDLLPYDGGFVITDYLDGSLVFWRNGGAYAETPLQTFFSPTALAQGRPPMFSPRDLLVTEKGVIFVEDTPNEGDLLSVYSLE